MSVSKNFLSQLLDRKKLQSINVADEARERLRVSASPFAAHPALRELRILQKAAKTLGLEDPFFRLHEGRGGAHTIINGKHYINFSHYNYLGLNGDPRVNAAAMEAIQKYGSSAGASRLVAGERPAHQQLEKGLADLYKAEAAIVFVSGHATNVSTISTLCGPGDLVLHDSLIHNSVLEGARASGATRRPFPHNDLKALGKLLEELRPSFRNVLVVVEGLYSMDGDIPDLPELIRLKDSYGFWLMVDEAHALGTLGEHGHGLAEHWQLDPSLVDIWMGTLSKTLAGCGGYIAGSQDLIDLLKASAPGFVYSVGMSPPLAAASLQALALMRAEPERVHKLAGNAKYFNSRMKEFFPEMATAEASAIVPFMLGSSRRAIELSTRLFEAGINVQPIIHPAVEEKASRLRFFLSSEHSASDIDTVFEALRQLAL